MYELFLDLDASASRSSSRSSTRSRATGARASIPTTSAPNLEPLFDTLLETIPAPSYDPTHPLQALVTNLDASPYVGRLALLRVRHGHAAQGPADRLVPRRTARSRTRASTELYVTEALDRVPAEEAGPGEIVALAGLPEVTIGETIADPDDPRPLPVTVVDEPSLSDHDRHQHLAARRHRRRRGSRRAWSSSGSTQELVGNVSLRVLPTGARTPGRCRAAASCSSRCSSR